MKTPNDDGYKVVSNHKTHPANNKFINQAFDWVGEDVPLKLEICHVDVAFGRYTIRKTKDYGVKLWFRNSEGDESVEWVLATFLTPNPRFDMFSSPRAGAIHRAKVEAYIDYDKIIKAKGLEWMYREFYLQDTPEFNPPPPPPNRLMAAIKRILKDIFTIY